MRSKSPIKITLEIPFPINDYDDNNVFYLDSCLNRKEFFRYKNLPLACINSEGQDWDSKIIGMIDTLELDCSKATLIAKGHLFSGGTAETVEFEDKTNKIKGLLFTEIGINIENYPKHQNTQGGN